MLKHLLIKNYALIDVLDIDFHEGFSVIPGETGAGKTTFIQVILSYFGIKKFVRSASFMLVSEFESKLCPIYHLDLYRLDENNTLDLGIDEYLFGDGISLIEWCDRLKYYNIKQRWEINIDYIDTGRKIKIERFV